jgi:hypothetical protein
MKPNQVINRKTPIDVDISSIVEPPFVVTG